jgi:hypothetical protein
VRSSAELVVIIDVEDDEDERNTSQLLLANIFRSLHGFLKKKARVRQRWSMKNDFNTQVLA